MRTRTEIYDQLQDEWRSETNHPNTPWFSAILEVLLDIRELLKEGASKS